MQRLQTFWRPFVKRFALCYRAIFMTAGCLSCLSDCNITVSWPHGWMDQDETWHAGCR